VKLIVNLLRWGHSSRNACIIFYSVAFAIPQCLYFGSDLYARGLLTIWNALTLAALAMICGAVVGTLGWWTVFKPLKDRMSR
jgi:hypothetical protein